MRHHHRVRLCLCIFLGANALLLVLLNQNNGKKSERIENVSFELNQEFQVHKYINEYFASILSQCDLFVIEPYVLSQTLQLDRLSELKWRFDVHQFEFSGASLTLAMFDHNKACLTDQSDVTVLAKVEGPVPNSDVTDLHHLFLKWRNLQVQIVVFHQVKHFFWIGQISKLLISSLDQFNIHFGKYEQIFDRFRLAQIDSVKFPDEIDHFLGQIPTSRFMRCPSESYNWLSENQIPISEFKIASSEEAIIGIKSMMKRLQMQFWIACGTLLGWYRQCHVTPYTTDTDFATWSKYLKGNALTSMMRQIGPEHNLHLSVRFGEPILSMEYSFHSIHMGEKVDLFFIYPNGTHFLLPYHLPSIGHYAYSIYPTYALCSIELLGHKLLAPCSAEKVILTEYGTNWQSSLPLWDYANSPLNSGPIIPFTANMSQEELFLRVNPQ